jgi:hypothetical protein
MLERMSERSNEYCCDLIDIALAAKAKRYEIPAK